MTAADDLDEILAWREERTVTQNLTLHYDRMMLLLDPTPLARGLVRKKVAVVNYPDGRFAVQFNGATLGFKVFDKIQTVQPGAIVDNKRLSAVLEQIKAQQAAYPARQQRGHGARQRPPNNLEAWTAVTRAATTPHRCRGTGLTSLVFRYVTENCHAKWSQTRWRHAIEQCRAPSPLSFASAGGTTGSPQTSAMPTGAAAQGAGTMPSPSSLTRQAIYAAWLEALPDTLQGYGDGGRPAPSLSSTETLAAIEPPQGYGRD